MTQPTHPTARDGRRDDMPPWERVSPGILLDGIAAMVEDWTPLPMADAKWLTATPLPSGWRTIPPARDASVSVQRIVARTAAAQTGIAACQALSAYQFTGLPSPGLLADNSDLALRSLAADGIRSDPLVLSQRANVAGVRSSGYVEVNGAQLWVRYSTYCRGSDRRHEGLVVEEVFVVPAALVTQCGREIGALSAAVRDAFTTRVGDADRETEQAATTAQHLRAGASGGPVLDAAQREFLATTLAMWDGVASHHRPPPELLGFDGGPAFDVAIAAMGEALKEEQPGFSVKDWTRLLLLAELSFASEVFGAGVEFELVSAWRDADALTLLRSIQRALAGVVDAAQLSS